MPYVDQGVRAALDSGCSPVTDGELVYVITQVCNKYVARGPRNFHTLSDVIKALECAKLEFYRRVLAPYEDQKCKENGDVYATKG